MRVIVSRQRRSGSIRPRLSALFLAALLLVGSFVTVYCVIGKDAGSAEVHSGADELDVTAVSAVLGTLESFSAHTPEDAVNIWAEGVSAKNGLTQYAVMTDALKERYMELLSDGGSFLFPTSAVRIDAWRITDVSEDEDGKISASLEFDIGGSASETAAAELTIEDFGDHSAVSAVAVEEPLYEFTGIG